MANSIMGTSICTAEQMCKYLLSKNPSPKLNGMDPLEFCKLYLEEGEAEGVRGDFAFCQSCHETGHFRYGGQVLQQQNNFAGIGATNNSPIGKGAWFNSQREGVRAQIQHLKAYASFNPLKKVKLYQAPVLTNGMKIEIYYKKSGIPENSQIWEDEATCY